MGSSLLASPASDVHPKSGSLSTCWVTLAVRFTASVQRIDRQ